MYLKLSVVLGEFSREKNLDGFFKIALEVLAKVGAAIVKKYFVTCFRW